MESKYMQIIVNFNKGQKQYFPYKKQVEAKKEGERTKSMKELVKNEADFKKDMAKFYGVNPAATRDIELGMIVGQ